MSQEKEIKGNWEEEFDVEFDADLVIHLFETKQFEKIKSFIRQLLTKRDKMWQTEIKLSFEDLKLVMEILRNELENLEYHRISFKLKMPNEYEKKLNEIWNRLWKVKYDWENEILCQKK